ncbi:MAG: hypothetical protein ISR52_10625 [Rhodospirillales bacterium]|nr:hypothetical protein [Rhodospirillales bacterium]
MPRRTLKHLLVSMLIAGGLLALSPARAETVYQCPDMTKAVQAGACQTEAELKLIFRSTCGGEQAPNAKNPGLCDTFKEFARWKNTSIWESPDGEFMGYVACALPPERIKAAKATDIVVAKRRSLTLVICNYTDDVSLTLRTKGKCSLAGTGKARRAKCGPDPASCKAVCE